VTTLKAKRDEIESAIVGYERKLAQAKADLSHVNACIALFEASGDIGQMAPYVDLHRLFGYREIVTRCRAILADGPLSTRQIALKIMEGKGLDTGDKVLAKAMTLRICHSLRMQCRMGKLADLGKERGVRVWRLPAKG
jgi:hypothetical protein